MTPRRWPVRASAYIGRPVRLGAVQVGVVTDVIANRSLGHVLGFEVCQSSSATRFLPWVGAELERDHVAVRSVYSLLSPTELPLFLDHGVRISEHVRGGGAETIRDIVVDRDGDVAAVVLEDGPHACEHAASSDAGRSAL